VNWPWVLPLAVLALPALGLLYQAAGARRGRRRHPAPGRMVEAAGTRFHIHERGRGRAVVLEAGIAASSLSWKLAAAELARDFRVITYDRAGFAWSGAPPSPRTMPNLCAELDALLAAAGVETPAVFAGHSFGGLLLRHFAARYPGRVAALVLADPLDPADWRPLTDEQARRLRMGVMLARRGAVLARFGVVRLALDALLSGARALPKWLARASSGPGAAVPHRLAGEIRKLPPELWAPICAHWSQPRSFLTLAEYLERLPANCALPPGDEALAGLPLVVLSAADSAPRAIAAHARTAALSARGKHIVVSGCGHWIQLDRPEAIAQAVRGVVESP
jgi:pimeloyl-ACP methyl ester carboxylesterase